MTEFWKSNPNHWCEYCKVWLKDTTQSRAVHERGVKHQENVARKLSDMRKKADDDKRHESEMASTMGKIEAQAQRRFEEDQRAEQEHRRRALGTWELKMETGYHYNAVHRYYRDPTTGMYYGGDPPEWTSVPDIPNEARYEVMAGTVPPAAPARAAPAAAAAAPASSTGRGPAAPRTGLVAAGSRAVASHPLASVGGHQMPDVGRIGGAKGVGLVQQRKSAEDAAKRKRDAGGKPVSKEEEEARARREAARLRVEQRTMASFGLQ